MIKKMDVAVKFLRKGWALRSGPKKAHLIKKNRMPKKVEPLLAHTLHSWAQYANAYLQIDNGTVIYNKDWKELANMKRDATKGKGKKPKSEVTHGPTPSADSDDS